MTDALQAIGRIAAGGLEAQSVRLRIASENIANARSTGNTSGADPYTRKTVMFQAQLDRELGATAVSVKGVSTDETPFRIEYDPGHPAADEAGNVKLPNVDMLVEMADMREATRSYEANLQMMKQARSMITMTIDLLRGS
jgi:flagellar basal-body rod protein FlgC